MGFVAGGAVLLFVLAGLFTVVQTAGADTSETSDENLRHDAHDLANLLSERQGAGWGAGPDAITQIGLRNDNGSGLDLDRIAALKGAGYDAAVNGKVDYNETLALLGMDPNGPGSFHLRIAPVGLQAAIASVGLGGIRTMYIADYDGPPTSVDVLLATDDLMVADARNQIDADMSAAAADERGLLLGMGLGFDDETRLTGWDVDAVLPPTYREPLEDVVDPAMLEGDVYPDTKQFLNDQVPAAIGDYDLVIIGSNVDHSALTSNAVKAAIDAYVDAGGVLIVFGSDSQSFQWMESLMGTGIETANAGAFAPDVDHALLREPYPLSWPDYSDFGQAWGGKSSGNNRFDDLFQHVISDGDGDVMAVSKDGAFGDGRVFLTTYRPSQIEEFISTEEATHIIHNMVVYAEHSDLYLDYGPPPPQDGSVGAAVRTTYVWDPDFGLVPVRLTVLSWGT